MSLPLAFATSEEYFETCLKFFTRYQYWVTTPNTHVLVNKTLNHIDDHVLEATDVYDENFKLTDLKELDEYFHDFLNALEELGVEYEEVQDRETEVDFEAPVSMKKKYEVVKLVKEVKDWCGIHGCDTVVDFGCGLGYLDQRYYEETGYNVLGIECDVSHHSRAVARQKKYHEKSLQNVVYVQHRISKKSHRDIAKYLKESFENHGSVCITGLHSCGDLTVDGMNIFLKMVDVKALILMPCCYHKMEQHEGRFKNFPLSKTLKRIFEKHKGFEFMHIPFLRLAAHPTHNDQDLEEMVFSLLARAVLQVYARANNCALKRRKQKAIKKCSSFETYIQQAATTGYTLTPGPGERIPGSDDEQGERINGFDLEALREIWQSLPKITFKKAAVYILMQNLLQPVIENFLLYDRLVYLRESGVECGHRKVFREHQSPRCIALLAVKNGGG